MEENNINQNYPKITKLKSILGERGISQSQFAELIDMEKNQIIQICSGVRTNIMMDNAKKICGALGLTLDEVFGD